MFAITGILAAKPKPLAGPCHRLGQPMEVMVRRIPAKRISGKGMGIPLLLEGSAGAGLPGPAVLYPAHQAMRIDLGAVVSREEVMEVLGHTQAKAAIAHQILT